MHRAEPGKDAVSLRGCTCGGIPEFSTKNQVGLAVNDQLTAVARLGNPGHFCGTCQQGTGEASHDQQKEFGYEDQDFHSRLSVCLTKQA